MTASGARPVAGLCARALAAPVALAAAALALAASALALGATALPGAAAAAPAPVAASTNPCAPSTPSGACTVDPATLQASWPAGATVHGVQVSWVATGRPAAAPSPGSAVASLAVTDGFCSTSGGQTGCAWAWPAGLAGPGSTVLNGTYQVAACADVDAAGHCSPSGLDPGAVGLAVPPAAPSGFTRSVNGRNVTLAWAAGPEPDLAGYRVQRDATTVFACSLHGASGGGQPCPATPGFVDAAPAGAHTWRLVALRFGATPAASSEVASAPAAVTAIAPGTPGISAGAVRLPPAPYQGPVRTLPPGRPAATHPTAAAAAGDAGYQQDLPTTENGPADAAPVAATEDGASHHDVQGPALVAAGTILLALAAHAWYLRAAIHRRDTMFFGGIGTPEG